MQDNQSEFSYSSKVGEYVKSVIKNRKEEISIPQVAELTGIPKSCLYQIIPVRDVPTKNIKLAPTRNMLLAIALTLNFSTEETQNLLKCAGESALDENNNFDNTIIYALEHKLSIVKANILLDENNCELLIFEK